MPDPTLSLPLDAAEARILGALIEKEITTPEYYPLTLNALTNACNQKNNREPVVAFDEATVVRGLERLREKAFVGTVTGAGIRVPKYKHGVRELFILTPRELSVLCLLLLRGPQTLGELRTRSGPLHAFSSAEEVQATLDSLSSHDARPALAAKLPRQPGQKEARYAHLLCGPPEAERPADTTRPEPARLRVLEENERIARLEEELSALRTAIEELRTQFKTFRKQFD